MDTIDLTDLQIEYNRTMEELNKDPTEHEYANKAFLAKEKFDRMVRKMEYLKRVEFILLLK